MKLTIYLLRSTVKDVTDVLIGKNSGYTEFDLRHELPFRCRAWIERNKAKAPRWVDWLSESFDLTEVDLVNQSNSAILVLEARERHFVVTFGYGFSAIDRTIVETDFGLRAVLNSVDPNALDTLDTRTLDRITKQTRTHLNVGRPVQEFGIETDVDWLRSVRGRATVSGIDGKMQGADSVQIQWNHGIATLGDCCATLLELYESEVYRSNFRFIDHLRPLRTTDPLRSTLEERVIYLLDQRDDDFITLAHPDIPPPNVQTFKLWCGHLKHDDIEDLDMNSVLEFLDSYEARKDELPDLKKTWVLALDDEGHPLLKKTPLWNYLVAHVEHDSHTYVLSLGQWFRTDRDYIQGLREKVESIPDVTDDLCLPTWEFGVNEKDYNRKAAEECSFSES